MKEVNKQQVYSSSEFSMYNVHQYIKKIEDLEDFKYPFERLKKVENIGEEDEAKPEEENKIEEKPEAEEEDDEPQIQEVTEEEANMINTKQNQKEETKED